MEFCRCIKAMAPEGSQPQLGSESSQHTAPYVEFLAQGKVVGGLAQNEVRGDNEFVALKTCSCECEPTSKGEVE